ncbi:hypothetical protein EW145_g585 [Phellinidium pouzarii]|uniref:PPM-type phosphatase domain-containing protein n=1 Tax=Phellinidium pouzarii TaxID=167371 RepID=A0A4S4LIF2_9AGAM|nr:hypothetical protein EW145_g585 [Phellinidium pouzarii]
MASFIDEKVIHHAKQDAASTSSSVVGGKVDGVGEPHKLKRQLKNRHIAMISIGGVIGTGLFLGTATALQQGGPVGLLLGYLIVGTVCFSVMISLGEMVAYLPVPGGHIKLADRFVDPAFSFTMGWNYWYNWTVILPAELSAASVLMTLWKSKEEVSPAVWITMCLVVVIAINMFGAGAYGEAEFIFASIKVVTITGLIILGIVLDLGGGPNHDRIGFRYWKNPGPFVQFDDISGNTGKFLGWWAVMTQAAFSFIGTEIVAIAAGEAKNPRRNLPKAIKRVYIRILLFYIGGTIIIGLLVPSNDPNLNLNSGTAAGSPFVIAIQKAGIKGLPSVINAALLTSAWSAASSDLYTSSRAIYGLALSGNAPKIFSYTTKRGLPLVALGFCASFSFLAYMGVSTGAGKVFQWFVNMTSVAGLMTWFGICVTYLRFYKGFRVQGFSRATLPYASKLNPYAAWYAVIACPVICFFSGFQVFVKGNWDTATFVTNYLPLMLFPVLYVSSRLWLKCKPIRASDMDFVTGLKEIEDDTYDEPPPRNWAERFWGWLPAIKDLAPRIKAPGCSDAVYDSSRYPLPWRRCSESTMQECSRAAAAAVTVTTLEDDDQRNLPRSAGSSASVASCVYTPLNAVEVDDALVDLAHPYTGVLDLERGLKADGLSFQPCMAARCQDRYVVEQFTLRGAREQSGGGAQWTLTGVFDGHLGEATVEHVAHHLPVIVQEFLEEAVSDDPASIEDPAFVTALLKRAFVSFDRDIANDVLALFPGGISSLDQLSDDYIRCVINDYESGLQNYKKVQLNMYGTTALLALVDSRQENLWVANLGDCQAVLASCSSSGEWVGELLTEAHNGTNLREIERVKREHPNEPDCIKNGRILGTIAPFRCIGDQPFKQLPAFTRRILFNLDTGPREDVGVSHAAWEQLLSRNLTPPYISADADIVHRRLTRGAVPGSPSQFLVLCTDGLQELFDSMPVYEQSQKYVDAVMLPGDEEAIFKVDDNLALRILKKALGGDDTNAVSQMITAQSDRAWLDDITIVVQIL